MDIISVIIPVYNSAETLEQCIDSVTNQTYENLEIILVNDGSTDDSAKICDEFALKDHRIKVYSQENQGLSAARNTGLRKISGDFVFFLDSDDFIKNQTLELLIEEAKLNNSEIVSSALKNFWDGDSREGRIQQQRSNSRVKFIHGSTKYFFIQQITNHACGKLFRRNLLDGIAFPKGRVYEDVATTYKLYLRAERISHTVEGLYMYRQHKGTITGDNSGKNIVDLVDSCKEVIDTIQNEDACVQDHWFYIATLLFTTYTRLSKLDKDQPEKNKYHQFIKTELKQAFQHFRLLAYTESPFFIKLCLYRAHLSGPILFIREEMHHGRKSRTH